MRERWTDERLDDLNGKVDDGFRRMDDQFARVDERFARIDARLDKLGHQFTYGVLMFSGVLVAGFTAILTKL